MLGEWGADVVEVREEGWEFLEEGAAGVDYEGICDAQIWRERHADD